MNPSLERLQVQFVVKQCNHPEVDSAAIPPGVGIPVFKHTPIPALETREAAECRVLWLIALQDCILF